MICLFVTSKLNMFTILQEIFFINISQLVSNSDEREKKRIYLAKQRQFQLSICFLPIYLMSAVFRLLTFILLFTYLNVWAFCPMMVSWILNVSNIHLKKPNIYLKNQQHSYINAQKILVATSAVFIPIFIRDIQSSK